MHLQRLCIRVVPLLAAILTLLTSSAARVRAATAAEPPNIVVIFIDDMGYGDIGPFGSTKNRTPALDRMAKEGVKFTNFYAAPVCSASRAQLLTGCYAPRVSIPGVLSPNAPIGLNPQEHTLASLLKQRGYATMCIGKWHLGDQPDFFPTHYGFDHYFGLPYSNDMLRARAEGGEKVVPLMRDNAVIELLTSEQEDTLTRQYTNEAIAFIRANAGHRFFLYLAHTAVHVPIRPGPEFRGRSPHGRYSDWVEEMDWSTGQVLDTLRDLKLDRNTLVFFTSDNGPWLIQGADAGSAGPLRGGKGSTWEGGVREPALAWWPGTIQPGTVSHAIAGTIDLLPTCVGLAGGTVPTDRRTDGADLRDVLLGRADASARTTHLYYLNFELQAVRQGPWKLAVKPQVFSMGITAGGVSERGLRLYNLDTDIGEKTDVAAAHPDIVARLKAVAVDASETLCDGLHRPGVRAPGRVATPHPLYPMEPPAPKKAKATN